MQLERENQVILLMITDGKNWHYLGNNIKSQGRLLLLKLFSLI